MSDQMLVDWGGLQYYHTKVTQHISDVSEKFFKAGGDVTSLPRPEHKNFNYIYKVNAEVIVGRDNAIEDFDYVPGTRFNAGSLFYVTNVNGQYKYRVFVEAIKDAADVNEQLKLIESEIERIKNTYEHIPTHEDIETAIDNAVEDCVTQDVLETACDAIRAEIPSLDAYATHEDVKEHINAIDLTSYVSKDYVDGCITTLQIPRKTSDLTNDAKFVNEEKLINVIENKADVAHKHHLSDIEGYKEPDLSPYAKKTDIPTKVSALHNDAGYLKTTDLAGYVKEDTLIAQVNNINTNTSLNAANIKYLEKDMDSVQSAIAQNAAEILNNDKRLDKVEVEVVGKANKSEIPTKVSQLLNDAGYITEHVDISGKADKDHVHRMKDIIDFVQPKVPTNLSELENDRNFATQTYVDNAIDNIVFPQPNLTNFASKSWVENKGYLTSVPNEYITEAELELKGYLTRVPGEYVTEAELNAKQYLTEAHLAGYAKNAALPTKMSDLTNDTNFISKTYVDNAINNIEIPKVDLDGYATESFVKTEISKAQIAGGELEADQLEALLNDYYRKAETYSKEEIDGTLTHYTKLSQLPDFNAFAKTSEVNSKLSTKLDTEDYNNEKTSFALKSELFSRSYNDLTDKPQIPSLVGYATKNYVDSEIAKIDIPDVDLSGKLDVAVYEADKPKFALQSQLFSGSYHDLQDKPTIPSLEGYATQTWVADQHYVTENALENKADNVHTHVVADISDIQSTLSNYETISSVDNKLAEKVSLQTYAEDKKSFLTSSNLKGYATEEWVNGKRYLVANDIAGKADKTEITNLITAAQALDAVEAAGYIKSHDVADLIPETYVTNDELTSAINNIEHPSVDLSDYYKKSEADNAVQTAIDAIQIPSVEGLASEAYVDEKFASIPKTDLTDYATQDWVKGQGFLTSIDEKYVTKSELDSEGFVKDISGKADVDHKHTLADIEDYEAPDLTDYATQEFVTNALKDVDVDLTGYATEQWVGQQGYITEHQDISHKLDKAVYDEDKTTFAIKSDVESLVIDKANNVLFNDENAIVNIAVGNFKVGDNIKGLTLKEIITTLLGITIKIEVTPEEVKTNSIPVYQSGVKTGDSGEVAVESTASEFTYVELNKAQESEAPQSAEPGTAAFFEIKDEETGEVLKHGYQVYTVSTGRGTYWRVSIAEGLTIKEVLMWDELTSAWVNYTPTLVDTGERITENGYTYMVYQSSDRANEEILRIVLN